MNRTPPKAPPVQPVFYGPRFAIARRNKLLRNYGQVRTWDTLEEAYRAAAAMLHWTLEKYLDAMEPIVGKQSFDPRNQPQPQTQEGPVAA